MNFRATVNFFLKENVFVYDHFFEVALLQVHVLTLCIRAKEATPINRKQVNFHMSKELFILGCSISFMMLINGKKNIINNHSEESTCHT